MEMISFRPKRSCHTKNWGDRIRQENNSPNIYAVVLNDGSFPFKAKDETVKDRTEEQWRCSDLYNVIKK